MEDERNIARITAEEARENRASDLVEIGAESLAGLGPLDSEALIRFNVSPPQPCPYLPDRIERKIWTEIGDASPTEYGRLSRCGFRRSHMIAYQPACPTCNACVSIRVPVAQFDWTRAWRKITNRNADLKVTLNAPRATPEQYVLFERYLETRHGEGDMAGMGFLEYRWMIEDSPQHTQLAEFTAPDGELIAACLLDRFDDGLSAVYSFFEPDLARRSLGSHIILWLIEEAARRGLPYAYLGYWIAESEKMDYKARFRPIEGLGPDGVWRPLSGV